MKAQRKSKSQYRHLGDNIYKKLDKDGYAVGSPYKFNPGNRTMVLMK